MAEAAEGLVPLPSEGFDLVEVSFGRVDCLHRVRVRTNAYLAPLPPGTTLQVKLGPTTVDAWHQGSRVRRR